MIACGGLFPTQDKANAKLEINILRINKTIQIIMLKTPNEAEIGITVKMQFIIESIIKHV